jgi:2-keto-4-pentenoate hydratase/2-oxohepta-3-ene-1,7-dioic acid hydratase in catechol pathway
MKFCRFQSDAHINYGLIESVAGRDTITSVISDPHLGTEASYETIPDILLADAALLCPVQPSKIVCIGRNYREHAAELGNEVPSEPLIFLKPPSSLLDPGGKIILPPMSNRVDYEGELGVVIGKVCRKAG